jgi:hypothetical protein
MRNAQGFDHYYNATHSRCDTVEVELVQTGTSDAETSFEVTINVYTSDDK